MLPQTGRARIQWYGHRVSAQMQADLKGLRLATSYCRKRIVLVISKSSRVGSGARSPGPGVGPPMRFEHSKPGQPPRADTGKLRQSIYGQVHRERMLGEVGTTLKYGAGLEKGTKAHTIVPRRKRFLVFGVARGGQTSFRRGGRTQRRDRDAVTGRFVARSHWVFARRVRHPGTKPRPYIFRTVQRNRQRLMALICRPAQTRMRVV